MCLFRALAADVLFAANGNLNPLTSIVVSAVDVSNKAPHAPVVLVVSNEDSAKKTGGQ